MIYKQVTLVIALLLTAISMSAQNIDSSKVFFRYPESMKCDTTEDIDSDKEICDCDSLHTIYYERYIKRIHNDTVFVPYSAVVVVHFLGTVPCSTFYINQTLTRVYRIAVDSTLLINVAEDFTKTFSEDISNCSYLLVHPCTRYTCPDFTWKLDKSYTAGVGVGHGFQDMVLFALYNASSLFLIDEKAPTLECEYHEHKELEKILQDCEIK